MVITPNTHQLHKANNEKLINKIKMDLRWEILPLAPMGRLEIIEINDEEC